MGLRQKICADFSLVVETRVQFVSNLTIFGRGHFVLRGTSSMLERGLALSLAAKDVFDWVLGAAPLNTMVGTKVRDEIFIKDIRRLN